MKKAIYLLMLVVSMVFTSCEKDEIGGTATEALAGEWYVRLDCVDANGNVVPVTVIEAGPCVVSQKKTMENDGKLYRRSYSLHSGRNHNHR